MSHPGREEVTIIKFVYTNKFKNVLLYSKIILILKTNRITIINFISIIIIQSVGTLRYNKILVVIN